MSLTTDCPTRNMKYGPGRRFTNVTGPTADEHTTGHVVVAAARSERSTVSNSEVSAIDHWHKNYTEDSIVHTTTQPTVSPVYRSRHLAEYKL